MNAWKHIFFSFAICVASGFGQGAVEFENAVGFGDGIDRLVRDANGALPQRQPDLLLPKQQHVGLFLGDA